jgi:DNA-binding NtrC family response regulator
MLVEHFIKKYCTSMSRDKITIDQSALKRIEEYDFPGNVRELENMIERAIVVGNGKEIRLKDLPLEKDIIRDSNDTLQELERKYIQQTLAKYDWNISRSAKALKIDRVTMYNKIRKYKLKSPKSK